MKKLKEQNIVTLGAALQDIYLIDHDDLTTAKIGDKVILDKVLPGSKVDIDKLSYSTGGGALNAAVTLAHFGHNVTIMTNIGDDSAGANIMATLDRAEIDNAYVEILPKAVTGTSIILLNSKTGERTIFTFRGASNKFNNLIASDLENMPAPDWLYISTLRGDFRTLTSFLNKAKELGIKVMMNPGTKELDRPEKLLKLLDRVDVLMVNKEEAARLVPGSNLTELLYHLSGYTPITIITDGPMGGIAGNTETSEKYRFGTYEDAPPIDATGAGDAFGSAFLASLAGGREFKEALIYGAANSTEVIRRIGANLKTLTGTEALHPMPIQEIN